MENSAAGEGCSVPRPLGCCGGGKGWAKGGKGGAGRRDEGTGENGGMESKGVGGVEGEWMREEEEWREGEV